MLDQAIAYWTDAWQRSVLTLEALNERGNIHLAQATKDVPNVLNFAVELILDGREFERPVNYGLVRILPPEGAAIDPAKPPIVVVDPRAGHGPGIGGMKPDSEIGVATRAGHPCYFVGFTPEPMPGQTIEDVCRAEALFIEEIARRHPDADSRPIVIANCQAGWQTMMTAAIRPDLMGPIVVVGSPLSYWAGVRGKNPMRYLGGALGGTWLTALSGDLGAGKFDGANLVANFELANLANTFWTKEYNVYANVDTEKERFLSFETWWGSPVLANAGEMQWIVDNLFVGNKLATGQIRASDGLRIDLRNIKSPIVCFCSWGDNITPPQQALDWILDLYDNVDEIVANGQTIVYSLHHTIGHLGIFVSGKVALKEHREFVSCMEMIQAMPPGLYEATIVEVTDKTENRQLIDGKYLFRLEARTLDDIRAFGVNSADDEKRFEAVARVSEVNLGFYRAFAEPWVRAMTTERTAEALRQMHPHRVRRVAFSPTRIRSWQREIIETGRALLKEESVIAFGHRVVHGGLDYAAPVRVTETVLDDLAKLAPLAPLHQPHNLAPIRAIMKAAPQIPQIACFDTAFHRAQSNLAQAFALPRRFCEEGVRRYGFHGLSYEFLASRLRELAPELADGRIVFAHLGNGASLCAVKDGRSVAATMGFTAVDGLMMGTRCGAIDPGVILYMMQRHGMDAATIEDLIYKRSGLLGVSGISSDMRALRASPDPAAKEAIALFVYRIVRELGSLVAALGGVDGLVFSAGIGERDALTRAEVVEGSRWTTPARPVEKPRPAQKRIELCPPSFLIIAD